MTRSKRSRKGKTQSGIMNDLMMYIVRAIGEADEEAAAERVEKLREEHPHASALELAEMLTRQKCLQTGAVGAVTSGASMIPGLGTMVSLTFGVAADIGMTFKMQAELVLEIAVVYQRELNRTDKRNAVMLVTGVSVGANQLLGQAGKRISQKTSERLARKSLVKAIPVFGVAASAGTNIFTTYVIGQRANAFFSLGPEAVGDWAESVRAVSGVDERKLIGWLTETTEHSWDLVSHSAQSAAGVVIVAGKSAGELAVTTAGKAGQAVAEAGKTVIEGAGAAASAAVDAGKKAGEGIATGASKAGGAVADAGKGVVEGAGVAAETAVDLSRKAGEGVVTGVDKAGEAVTVVGKGVAEGADAAKKRFSKAFKGLRRGKAEIEGETEAVE